MFSQQFRINKQGVNLITKNYLGEHREKHKNKPI